MSDVERVGRRSKTESVQKYKFRPLDCSFNMLGTSYSSPLVEITSGALSR